MKKRFAFTLLALTVGTAASAQLPTAPPPRLVGDPPAPPVGPKGPETAKKDEPKESPRMTRLKALTFDRRPSSILAAWAPKAEANKAAPPKDPAAKAPDPKAAALGKELAAFQKDVTLGNWDRVKTYLRSLPTDEAAAGYKQLLQNLRMPPMPGMPTGVVVEGQPAEMMVVNPAGLAFPEKNVFSADDVFGLAAAAPTGDTPATPEAVKERLTALAAILQLAVAGGTLPEVAVARLRADTAKAAGESVFTKRQAARLLADAGLPEHVGDFLPGPDEAAQANDVEALNLLARHFLALHAQESKSGNLEKAWAAVQTVLAVPDGVPAEKEEALLRAVELAPRLKDELGQAWLDASFTKDATRGKEILAAVGTLVARGLSATPQAIDQRLNALKLSQTAVAALLKAAPERAAEWRNVLTLLALGWQQEADFSRQYDRSSGNPQLRRDVFGNIFFSSGDDDPARMMMMQQPNLPRPILVADVIKAAPTPAWVAAIDESLRPKLAAAVARLHLKVNDEDKAFPLIEQLAPAQPGEAKGLVAEFLRVWTRNHDPNGSRNENRYSWFFFAFEQRAESIPLTRSKQERNLTELAGWVARIKKLPGVASELDDETVVKAFTACHSSAEVYRTEAIESVFGPLGGLKPKTLAGLADQMRSNLAGLWKEPAVQQQQKTKRKKKDIQAEVLRGYEVAAGVVGDGLTASPDHWALLAARAGLLHDEAHYRQELSKSATFSAKRSAAFAVYRQAAEQYAKAVRTLPESDHTTAVYEQWFAASLGAVDLGMITEDRQPDWTQPPLIRAALLALPGDLAETHLGKFANNLFIKMSGAKPHVKFNYLKAGFQIVGDHPRAAEAKKVFDYYKDLVTEIRLEAAVDGSTRVGHARPFGLFVNLAHTRDIERESGGFGRYLQNQNSMSFSYNYGRPTADYRDRFETAARTALKEQFEVISVTFQDEKVTSRAAAGEFGWRYTPYAYILLKPRGPQVDTVPPLRLDLDFLETSGYVVMPVESPAVPISARDPVGDSRPVEQLTVTQTLDERQADKGVLLLEVKAVGVGLVPDWEELAGEFAPDGFVVTKTDTQGLGVKKFDEDGDRNAVVSEQAWTVTLTGRDDRAELPKSFRFAPVRVPAKEVLYQRYADADLTPVAEEVSLEATYGKTKSDWGWYAAGIAGGALVLGAVAVLARSRRRGTVRPADELPATLDPFVVAGLLRQASQRPDLTAAQRAELNRELTELERYHFAAEANEYPAPDLRALAGRWAIAAT